MATVSYSGGGDFAYTTSDLSWANASTSVTTSSSGPLTISQTDSTSAVTIGTTYSTTAGASTPISISSGGYVYVTPPSPSDEIKSKPVPGDKHEHEIQCRLRVESTKVISEYFCNHCETVLFSKVISKIPKSIIKKQCLSRIVKGV